MTEMYSGLHVGQRFSSLEEFKTVIRSISVRQHWELRVSRSNKKSVVIGCRSSPNCFFRVVCRCNKNATYITSLQDSHSCRRSADSPASTPARSEASHVRFLLSEIPKLFDMETRIRGQDVVDAVKRYHGYHISMRQAQRALTKLQPRHAENDSETMMDMDHSAGDQPSPGHSQPESQGDGGPAYPETRWLSQNLQDPLLEEEDSPGTDTPSPQAPLPPAAPPPNTQAVRHPPPSQHQAQIGAPSQSALNTAPQSMNVSQSMHVSRPAVGFPTSGPLPVAGPEKVSNYPQRNEHTAVPQMVLTNFKIEFTCTACGALNQSFFPNQGNVTGGAYMPHHSVPNQSHVTREHARPEANAPRNDVGEAGAYDVNPPHSRTMHGAWAAGGLGVPIGPTHT